MDFSGILFTLLCCIATVSFFLWRTQIIRRLPPGPPPLPLLGNFFSLGSYPYKNFARLADTYGSIFTFWFATIPAVVVSSPELAQEVLKHQDHACASRNTVSVVMRALTQYRDIPTAPINKEWRRLRRVASFHICSARHILSWAGQRTNEVRRMVGALKEASLAGGGKGVRVRDYFFSATLNNMMMMCAGKRFAYPQAHAIAGLQSSDTCLAAHDEEGSYLRDLLDRTMKTFGTLHIVDLFPWLAGVDPQQGLQRATRLGAELRGYFHGLIEREREGVRVGGRMNDTWQVDRAQESKENTVGGGAERAGPVKSSVSGPCVDECEEMRVEGRETLVDLLLCNEKSSDGDVQLDADEQAMLLFDMVLGGSYTTSASTEWALAELAMQPDMVEKLRDEVDHWYEEKHRRVEESERSMDKTARVGGGEGGEERFTWLKSDGIMELPYLKAVVTETFRRHPYFPLLVPHETTAPITLAGYHLPAGTMLQVNIWAIAHDPAVWPDPFRFDPTRFLPPKSSTDARGQDFRLLAFGSGRRQCIGYDLAVDMMSRMLAAVVREFEIHLLPVTEGDGEGGGGGGGDVRMRERPGVTAALEEPLRVVLRPRDHWKGGAS